MTETKDNILIQEYLKGGDDRALEELIARYLPAVFAYVRRFTGNYDSAADIAQETFVKAWRNLKKYKPDMPFKNWLFTIAKHTAIDEFRAPRALTFSAMNSSNSEDFAQMIVDEGPSIPHLSDIAISLRRVALATAVLHPVPAHVIRLHTTDDLSFRQIAQKLRVPLNTVKSHYRRAIVSLRKILTQTSFAPKSRSQP